MQTLVGHALASDRSTRNSYPVNPAAGEPGAAGKVSECSTAPPAMPGIGMAPTLAVPSKLHLSFVANTHLSAGELRSMVVSGSAMAGQHHGANISAAIVRLMTR